MAKATLQEVPQPRRYMVTLELDQDEAATLLAVTRKIGGSPTDSRRAHTDAISVALAGSIGYEAAYVPAKEIMPSTSIHFYYTKKENV